MKKHTLIGLLLALLVLTAVLALLPSCKGGDKTPATTTAETTAGSTTATTTATTKATTKATTTATTKATTVTTLNPNGWQGDTATAFAGGTGTEADPYQIANGAQLAFLAAQVNAGEFYDGKYFKLTADIDLNNLPWIGIGEVKIDNNDNHIDNDANAALTKSFMGYFDGNYKTISNLYMNEPEKIGVGLFRVLRCGSVKNLAVKGSLTGRSMIAGLVALCCSGTTADPTVIEGCFFDGTLTGTHVAGNTGTNMGGITGRVHRYDGKNSNLTGVTEAPDNGFIRNNFAKVVFGGGQYNVTVTLLYGGMYKHKTHYTVENNYAVIGLPENAEFVAGKAATSTEILGNPTGFMATPMDAAQYADAYAAFKAGKLDSWTYTGAPWDGSIATGYAGGTGTAEDPYQISNAAELAYFAQQVNTTTTYQGQFFILTADINLSNRPWTPIGMTDNNNLHLTKDRPVQSFMGYFDGNNKTVFGLYINEPATNGMGLFKVLRCGEIRNLSVKGDLTGNAVVGGLVGFFLSGRPEDPTVVENCQFEGKITGYDGSIGGLIGRTHHYNGRLSSSENIAEGDTFPEQLPGNAVLRNNFVRVQLTAPVAVTVSYVYGGYASATIAITENNNYAVMGMPENAETEAAFVAAGAADKNLLGRYDSHRATAITSAQFDKAKAAFLKGEIFEVPVLPPAWDGATVATAYAGGTGTAEDPYQIATPDQLAYFAAQVNAGTDYNNVYFILTADINLGGKPWMGIGKPAEGLNDNNVPQDKWETAVPFNGYFDGNYKTIYGLYMNEPTAIGVGFFRCLRSGSIKNLAVMGEVTGRACAGGLVGIVHTGSNEDPTIVEGCFFEGTVTGVTIPGNGTAGQNVGGMFGRMHSYTGINDKDGNLNVVTMSKDNAFFRNNFVRVVMKETKLNLCTTILFGGWLSKNCTVENNYAVLGLPENVAYETAMDNIGNGHSTLGRSGYFFATGIDTDQFDEAYAAFLKGETWTAPADPAPADPAPAA